MRKQVEELRKLCKDYYSYTQEARTPKDFTTFRDTSQGFLSIEVYVTEGSFFSLRYDKELDMTVESNDVRVTLFSNHTDSFLDAAIDDLSSFLERLKAKLEVDLKENLKLEKQNLEEQMKSIQKQLKSL